MLYQSTGRRSRGPPRELGLPLDPRFAFAQSLEA